VPFCETNKETEFFTSKITYFEGISKPHTRWIHLGNVLYWLTDCCTKMRSTSSAAVADRPLDASCLSLASLQYVDRKFCFRFNTAYTVLFWAFHPRDTQAYWSSFKYFRQTRQHLEADRIEFADEDTALQCPYHLRTVIWLWDMDSPEGWWTAIRSVPHEFPTTDLRRALRPVAGQAFHWLTDWHCSVLSSS